MGSLSTGLPSDFGLTFACFGAGGEVDRLVGGVCHFACGQQVVACVHQRVVVGDGVVEVGAIDRRAVEMLQRHLDSIGVAHHVYGMFGLLVLSDLYVGRSIEMVVQTSQSVIGQTFGINPDS